MEAYPIAEEAIDLEVYVLAALFSGSKDLMKIEGEYTGLRWARRTFEMTEVSRRLISLAVMLRSKLDTGSDIRKEIVGSLTPDVSKPLQEQKLGLREACNKIIHADNVDLAPGQWANFEVPPVSRTIMLFGSFRRCDWTAQLDVLAFLNAISK